MRLTKVTILGVISSPAKQRTTAIAGFGQLLRDPRYLGNWGWNAAIDLADNARGADQFGYRAAAVTLMRLAQSLNTK